MQTYGQAFDVLGDTLRSLFDLDPEVGRRGYSLRSYGRGSFACALLDAVLAPCRVVAFSHPADHPIAHAGGAERKS